MSARWPRKAESAGSRNRTAGPSRIAIGHRRRPARADGDTRGAPSLRPQRPFRLAPPARVRPDSTHERQQHVPRIPDAGVPPWPASPASRARIRRARARPWIRADRGRHGGAAERAAGDARRDAGRAPLDVRRDGRPRSGRMRGVHGARRHTVPAPRRRRDGHRRGARVAAAGSGPRAGGVYVGSVIRRTRGRPRRHRAFRPAARSGPGFRRWPLPAVGDAERHRSLARPPLLAAHRTPVAGAA